MKCIKQSESTDMLPLVLEKPAARNEEMVACPCCRKAMLANPIEGHIANVHKHRNPVKRFVMGSVCLFRLKDYQ